MSFDAHEEKIRKIFSGDARFMIPRNQRKYVWEENLSKGNLLDRALMSKEGDGNKQVVKCLYFYYNFMSENCSSPAELVMIRDIILDMKVIHIASEDELDCYDIFEILNARGVDLEDSELLKNFIFKYAQPQYTIDRAKEVWAKIEKNMEECNGNMEQFLAHYVTYRYYKPTKEEGVFRIIKANINKSEVNILLDNLLEASKRYIIFYHPEKANNETIKRCLDFFALVNHRQFRPLFMSLMDGYDNGWFTDKQLNNVCSYLKNFSFAYTLVMRNASNNIDTKIHELSQEVYAKHSEMVLNKIKIELNKFYPVYTEFEAAFLNIGFSNKNKKYSNSHNRKRMRYIWSEIEKYEQKTNELVCNIKECNLEHIMNDSESNACVSRVGNILLLSEHINSNMGNDSFEEKKKKLGNSRLSTVKNFLKYYGNLDVWNEETIEKRTRAVAKFAYNKVWKLD